MEKNEQYLDTETSDFVESSNEHNDDVDAMAQYITLRFHGKPNLHVAMVYDVSPHESRLVSGDTLVCREIVPVSDVSIKTTTRVNDEIRFLYGEPESSV